MYIFLDTIQNLRKYSLLSILYPIIFLSATRMSFDIERRIGE